ncbi:MAG TPA: Gfo/Idh/MocA family oxidoreductase [Chloroflexota bacterium]|nr:Gfo/Idh/MocA family oxidoreductase [Chloroflexota bacterium]
MTIGVAIWGAGWVAGAHVRAYLANAGLDTRVVAIGSRREESARALAAQRGLQGVRFYTEYDQLLADPEVQIVSLCTPNGQHAYEAVTASQAGKHLLIEKPVATTPDDFDAVVNAVERADVTASACFIQRWNPLVNALRTMREQGDFGRVFMAQADYWFGRERPEWMRHANSAGSSFLIGAIHAVDSMRYILGADVVEVEARGVQVGDYYHFVPAAQALVRYSNGAIGTISSSLVGQTGYVLNMEIVGTDGSARNDQVYLKRIPGMQGWMTLPVPGPASGDVSQLPFPHLVEDLIRSIREGATPRANLPSTRNTHEVCFAVDRAIETGRAVALPLDR